MAELELSLYDVNKQIMNSLEPLDTDKVNSEMADIAAWISYEKNRYLMLLCRERNDYTIFHLIGTSMHIHEASQELLEVLHNRGEILDIEYTKGVYAIWLRIDDDSFVYHLFPYDAGVIEV